MLDVAGQDATEAFEDVGHSDEAREILDGLLVGNLKRQVRYDIVPEGYMTGWKEMLTAGLARRPTAQECRTASFRHSQAGWLRRAWCRRLRHCASWSCGCFLCVPVLAEQ